MQGHDNVLSKRRPCGGRLRGLAGLRGDAPSAARGVGDERAGRPCGARNKGDAARIDQVSASQQALVPGYQPRTAHGHRRPRALESFAVALMV